MPKGAKAQHAKKKQEKKKSAGKPKGINLSRIGRALGNFVSPGVGTIASMAGKAIDRVLGHGDYTVRMNTIMSNQAPQFASTGTGMRIAHREYVCDVNSTEFFSTRDYLINPGNKLLFPWLSAVANSFEEYELKGLLVTYKPTSGTAISSTSAAMGSVILSTEYDVLKPSFSTKQEMEAYQYTTPTVPYTGCIHPVECAPSMTVLPKKYVTSKTEISALDADDDPRLHYLGRFVYATAGQQSAGPVLGELWVSYDVVFYKPRLPPVSSLPTAFACYITKCDWSNGYPSTPFSDTSSVVLATPAITFRDTRDLGNHYSIGCDFNQEGTYLLMCSTVQQASGSAIGFSSDWAAETGANLVKAFTVDNDNGAVNGPAYLVQKYLRGTSGSFNDFGNNNVFFVDTPPGGSFLFPAPNKATVAVKGHIVYHAARVGNRGIFSATALDSDAPPAPKLVRQQGYMRSNIVRTSRPTPDTSCAAAAAATPRPTTENDSNEYVSLEDGEKLQRLLRQLNLAIQADKSVDPAIKREHLDFITTTLMNYWDYSQDEIERVSKQTIQKIDLYAGSRAK